ncbi:MAG: ABC transporter permease subunit [Azospirillaceae bacterium]|nr:ABC transporter permease subunit [Azospirillaceae bacterium]
MLRSPPARRRRRPTRATTPASRHRGLILPNAADMIALGLIVIVAVLTMVGVGELAAPLPSAPEGGISLDPVHLPGYALQTTLRMLTALRFSLLFTLIYAPLAAKLPRAGRVLVAALDILQSVPVTGYLALGAAALFQGVPGNPLRAELVATFALFTSQAWNMTFSFYQSLRTVPHDLDDAARAFRLSPWRRFWRLELPFAMPGLVWNMMMSMAGGWFFVVAAEAITVGDHQVLLPGIGSYVALAIQHRSLPAIGWALLAMTVTITLYDQLMFQPLVAWADKFRVEHAVGTVAPRSWLLRVIRRTRLLRRFGALLAWIRAVTGQVPGRWQRPGSGAARRRRAGSLKFWDMLTLGLTLAVMAIGIGILVRAIGDQTTTAELRDMLVMAGATLARITVMLALACGIWVPIGVMIGLRPRLAEHLQPLVQFLASFPANLLFPPVVLVIVRFDLDPDLWLSPLILLGTQWYILFNVIAGTANLPTDLRDAAVMFQLRGRSWWRRLIIPGILPSLVTGLITAAGGAWNASIVAETVSWGSTTISATGLGSAIAAASAAGDDRRVALGIGFMTVLVIVINHLVWRPLYRYAERRLTLD